ncbi:hypothetical protein FJV83_15085 [Mesorhizobium sp. WSM4307]|uniref:hypothetical protein n=1 Tax=unclassified Mesorhizobium TaxID=325217 RepID=UPI00115F5224|nr:MULTISPECIES: hypothetical protein [unclassified Mesorhizobium]TRC73604.1 hypothetical protein FJV81_24940 [Mesorhizobium sp. WSM4315]TRC85007.1 hypothetical protein FJV83_15085 [Mesorhizobium sp. WSM4307]
MSHREVGNSEALASRVVDLKTRMLDANITDGEIETFQKVAALLEDVHGRIEGDDLIAASFLVDPHVG